MPSQEVRLSPPTPACSSSSCPPNPEPQALEQHCWEQPFYFAQIAKCSLTAPPEAAEDSCSHWGESEGGMGKVKLRICFSFCKCTLLKPWLTPHGRGQREFTNCRVYISVTKLIYIFT